MFKKNPKIQIPSSPRKTYLNLNTRNIIQTEGLLRMIIQNLTYKLQDYVNIEAASELDKHTKQKSRQI